MFTALLLSLSLSPIEFDDQSFSIVQGDGVLDCTILGRGLECILDDGKVQTGFSLDLTHPSRSDGKVCVGEYCASCSAHGKGFDTKVSCIFTGPQGICGGSCYVQPIIYGCSGACADETGF